MKNTTIFLLLLLPILLQAQVDFSTLMTTYSQDFQTYAGTSGSVPANWTNSYNDYTPGGTYSNTGTYSNANSNRALNQDGSGDLAIGAKIGASEGPMNLTLSCINTIPGTVITGLSISWNAEQYSRGGRSTSLELVNNLSGSFSTPTLYVSTTGTGANLPTVSVNAFSVNYTGLNINPGSSFSLIWRITTGSPGGDGNNSHLGLDDVSISISSSSALPVELTGFTGKIYQNQATSLAWQTASELNNSHFCIERSGDGANFREIGTVNGAGTSFDFQDYAFTDKNPLPGKNYYRLRQVDFDGNHEYSKVIMVEIDARPTTKLYPSLAADAINLELGSALEEAVELLIFDNMGRLVAKQFIEAGATTVQFPLAGFQAGQYVASLQGPGQVENFRFVIQ
jgi:hypothetical protein